MVDVNVLGDGEVEIPNQRKGPNIDPKLLKQFQDIFARKRRIKELPKEVKANKLKLKKSKRLASNKSRKINQARTRHNKFTR